MQPIDPLLNNMVMEEEKKRKNSMWGTRELQLLGLQVVEAPTDREWVSESDSEGLSQFRGYDKEEEQQQQEETLEDSHWYGPDYVVYRDFIEFFSSPLEYLRSVHPEIRLV